MLKSLRLYGNSHITVTIQIVSHVLAYTNSCVNPVLYAFLSDNFRKAFRKVSNHKSTTIFKKNKQNRKTKNIARQISCIKNTYFGCKTKSIRLWPILWQTKHPIKYICDVLYLFVYLSTTIYNLHVSLSHPLSFIHKSCTINQMPIPEKFCILFLFFCILIYSIAFFSRAQKHEFRHGQRVILRNHIITHKRKYTAQKLHITTCARCAHYEYNNLL